MIKNKQFIKIMTMEILAKLDMIKELNKNNDDTDISSRIECAKDDMVVIQEILDSN